MNKTNKQSRRTVLKHNALPTMSSDKDITNSNIAYLRSNDVYQVKLCWLSLHTMVIQPTVSEHQLYKITLIQPK